VEFCYKLDAAGTQTVLYNFEGVHGAQPFAGLFLDPAGNLYGTTAFGGKLSKACTDGSGVVFMIAP
jgi:hypothetical protein